MGTIVCAGREGDVHGSGPVRYRILAEGPDFPVAIVESTVPAGFPGPVLHRHATMTDIVYVMEGTLAFDLGGERRTLGPGGFVLVPPGVVHTFSNPGMEPARFLDVYQPSGLEQYLKDVARRAAAGETMSQAEMAEIAMRYDFEPVTGDAS